jgi:excisionase family DNA binding protein
MINRESKLQAKRSQAMRMKDFEKWLTATDAAERIGISRQAIHKWLEDGKLRAVKTRLGWLIDPEAVEEAAQARKD